MLFVPDSIKKSISKAFEDCSNEVNKFTHAEKHAIFKLNAQMYNAVEVPDFELEKKQLHTLENILAVVEHIFLNRANFY